MSLRAIALLLALASSQASAGDMKLLGVGKPPGGGGGGSYTGPGDVVSGAKMWWGLRAYSAATRGTKAINLCDDTGANCSDVSSDATTGALASPGTHGSNNCATSGTCRIAIWYDQSGALNCGGSACDASQSTNSLRATLQYSCLGGKPCAQQTSSSGGYGTASGTGSAQPVTISDVANRTGTFTSSSEMFYDHATFAFGFNSAVDSMYFYTGSLLTFTVTDSATHAVQAVFNSSSSVGYVDGTSNSVSIPGSSLSSTTWTVFTGNSTPNANLFEMGVWFQAFASGDLSSMNSNQHTFWGF